MKKLYTLLFAAAAAFSINAQIINFPSSGFKTRLLAASASNMFAKNLSGAYFKIDANNNGEIEVSEAQQVSYLMARQCSSSSFSGIENFTNLETLHCDGNTLTSLNLSACVNLKNLFCNDNYLTSLNVSTCSGLLGLWCYGNYLPSIALNNHPVLRYLDANDNRLTNVDATILPNLELIDLDDNLVSYIDITNCPKLTSISCMNNPNLTTLLVKNGKTNTPVIYNCPNLIYICCDDEELAAFQSSAASWGYTLCQVNNYCSFTPGGVYYTFQGTNTVDTNGNGCDSSDPFVPYLRYNVTGTTTNQAIISGNVGVASIAVPEGTYTFSPVLENPSYFNISPASATATFPGSPSPFLQNFCLTPNGNHSDVEVFIIPLTPARPGFDSRYKVIYRNKGNQTMSGVITFSFEDNYMDFVAATPVQDSQSFSLLNWNYANLLPFEIREIEITLNINSPMETLPVHAGDLIKFYATITPIADEYSSDNMNGLRQIVVASQDPNDKTCTEGPMVLAEDVGEYVHYMIRFENTGTFAAENIVVKDIIDTAKYDISTLTPLRASHPFVTRIVNTNQAEFLFENINLPFDDANNDGYVFFKIKTKPTLVVGDTFSNTAGIYFDYNFPVITNTATTTVVNALNTTDFDFNSAFSLSPVPAKNNLTITNRQNITINSLSIYNTLGQLIRVETNPNETIDVSGLKTGTYFIKLITDKGISSTKFIKE